MIVDGAAWLKQLEAQDARAPVVMSHEHALAVARSLAAEQALRLGQRRMDAAIAGLATAA